MPETLKEFVISLGWAHDPEAQRKLFDTIEGATLRAKLLGDALEQVAIKVKGAVVNTADEFAKLGLLSSTFRTSGENIVAFGRAFENLGGSAEDARAALISVQRAVLDNRNMAEPFRKMGFDIDKTTGQLKTYNAELARAPGGIATMSQESARKFMQTMGLQASDQLIEKMRLHPEELQKQFDEIKKRTTDLIDYDQMEKNAQEFKTHYNNIMNSLSDATSGWIGEVQKALEGPLKDLDTWIKNHPDETKAGVLVGGMIGTIGVGALIKSMAGGFGLGGAATALTGSAGELSGAAMALKGAAVTGGAGKGTGVAAGSAIGAGSAIVTGVGLGAATAYGIYGADPQFARARTDLDKSIFSSIKRGWDWAWGGGAQAAKDAAFRNANDEDYLARKSRASLGGAGYGGYKRGMFLDTPYDEGTAQRELSLEQRRLDQIGRPDAYNRGASNSSSEQGSGELEAHVMMRSVGVPKMAVGGDISSEGLAYLHAGERVQPARVAQSGEDETHLKADGIRVGSGNPLPVTFGERDLLLLKGAIMLPGGGVLGGGYAGGGAGGSSPAAADGKKGGGIAGAGGASSGSFMDALAQIESGNRNIYSVVDPDVSGPGTRSQGYFQINTPTWRDFASKAGVDLNQYPNAMSAPRDVQARVAAMIPLSRFGPRTKRMLTQQFGSLDFRKSVGAYAQQFGPNEDAKVGGLPGDLSARLKEVYPQLSTGQCVELVQKMNKLGNVHDWLRGDPAALAQVGDAVATFGWHGDSESYAYGGSGTPGIGRDHAGDIVKKYDDGSIDILNQWRGQPPIISHIPYTGKGGEHDASSYYTIKQPGASKQAAAGKPFNRANLFLPEATHPDYFKPSLPSSDKTSSVGHEFNQNVTVNVDGATEPAMVAQQIGAAVKRSAADLTRHFKSAVA